MSKSKDKLVAEYDQLEDAIEEATPLERIWTLADWLAINVPNHGKGRPAKNSTRVEISIEQLAERGRRGKAQLHNLRQVADATRDNRLPEVSPRVYLEALRACKGDLEAANKRLKTKGKRLRDQSGPMESTKALAEQLAKRTGEAQAEVIDKVLANASPATISEIYHAAKLAHHNGYTSPAEKAEGKAHMDKNVTGPIKQALGHMTSITVISSLMEATEDLHELVSDGELSPQTYAKILDADKHWRQELEVAGAMVTMEGDIEGMAK